VIVTFGVIARKEPLLAELLALAFQSAGHDCLILKDVDHATRVLAAIRIDSIVLDIHMPGWNGLDWLETVAMTWPDLPSQTLLLTTTSLTPGEAARIERLGAQTVLRPISIVGVEQVVMARLRNAQCEPMGGARRGWGPDSPAHLVH
jgi:two-component system response regulator AtoC